MKEEQIKEQNQLLALLYAYSKYFWQLQNPRLLDHYIQCDQNTAFCAIFLLDLMMLFNLLCVLLD